MKNMTSYLGAIAIVSIFAVSKAQAQAEVKYQGSSTFTTYIHDCLLLAGNDEIRITAPYIDPVSMCAGNDLANGSTLADQIFGDGGNDVIHGHEGGDALYGGADDDVIYGGDGEDKLYGGSGDDILYGDTEFGYDDELYGGAGDDILLGGLGVNKLDGGDGSDTASYLDTPPVAGNIVLNLNDPLDPNVNVPDIFISIENIIGTLYDDHITGDSEKNTLTGKAGDDTLYGRGGDDILNGSNGNDTCFGGNGNDILNGGGGSDIVHGGNGDDVVRGHSGDDTLKGHDGNDRLIGGTDNDTLYGGTGSDIIVFLTNDGLDTITDFDPIDGDIIQIDGTTVWPSSLTLGVDSSGNPVVLYGAGDKITLENLDINDWISAEQNQ